MPGQVARDRWGIEERSHCAAHADERMHRAQRHQELVDLQQSSGKQQFAIAQGCWLLPAMLPSCHAQDNFVPLCPLPCKALPPILMAIDVGQSQRQTIPPPFYLFVPLLPQPLPPPLPVYSPLSPGPLPPLTCV